MFFGMKTPFGTYLPGKVTSVVLHKDGVMTGFQNEASASDIIDGAEYITEEFFPGTIDKGFFEDRAVAFSIKVPLWDNYVSTRSVENIDSIWIVFDWPRLTNAEWDACFLAITNRPVTSAPLMVSLVADMYSKGRIGRGNWGN